MAGHPHTRTIELPTIFPVSLVCSSASSARKYRPHARQIATNITIRYPATYTVAVYMKAIAGCGVSVDVAAGEKFEYVCSTCM